MATTQAEIEAAYQAIVKANEDTSGASFSELLRTFARVAVEAAERARWQPIETAPKDGTWILVWWPSSNVRDAAWFQYPPDEPGRWVEGTGKPMAPTHWQLLPSPPESK